MQRVCTDDFSSKTPGSQCEGVIPWQEHLINTSCKRCSVAAPGATGQGRQAGGSLAGIKQQQEPPAQMFP